MIGGKTVAGMAFGGVSIAGLCKAGVVIWRKPKPEWTDQTDKIISICGLPPGVTIAKDDSDYVLTVSSALTENTRILGFDGTILGSISADWPEEGTLRVTCDHSDLDIKIDSNGSGISANWAPFQVTGPTKASNSMWLGLWLRQDVQPGAYRIYLKFETKSA